MPNLSKSKHSRSVTLLFAAFFCAFSVFACRPGVQGGGTPDGGTFDASGGSPQSGGTAEPEQTRLGSFVVASPAVLVNSASLGAWTATTNGINVAVGETVSIKLADSAGARLWQLAVVGTDELVVAPTITQAVSVSGTATFVAPSVPSDGWALIIRSQIGYTALGNDSTGRTNTAYSTTFGVYLLTSNSYRVGAVNETVEGSAAFGWAAKFNPLLRATVATGSAVGTSRAINTTGLQQGGGNLSADRTHSIVPGTNGQAIVTAAGVPTWSFIANANISSSAAIDLSKLSQAAATTGQAITWNGTTWAPATASAGVPSARTVTAGAGLTGGGDLSANRTLDVVAANSTITVNADSIQVGTGVPVASLAAGGTANRVVLTTDGTNVTMGQVNLSSQVTGSLPASGLANGTSGQVLTTNTSPATVWSTPAGDWSGAVTANTVGKINGTTIATAGGSLTTGQSLRVTGSATADWGAVDLANANALTGTLPIAKGGTGQTAFGLGTLQSDGSSLFSGASSTFSIEHTAGRGVVVNSNGDPDPASPYYTNWPDNSASFVEIPIIPHWGNVDGFLDGQLINPENTFGTTVRSAVSTLFTLGTGQSSITISARMRMPVGKANTRVDVSIYDSDLTNELATTNVTLTQTVQTVSVALGSMTPGKLYRYGILYNKASQQCSPLVAASIAFTPNAGTGVFAGNYVRIPVYVDMAPGNLAQGYQSANFFTQGTSYDFQFATDAANIGVEAFANGAGLDPLYYSIKGKWQQSGSFPDQKITIDNVAVTAPYALRQVYPFVARTPAQGSTAEQGVHVRAFYLPANANYQFTPTPARLLRIYSDSIGCGYSATVPELQGWASHVRLRYPGRTHIEARPTRTLWSDVHSAALAESFGAYLAKGEPDILIIVIGVNDYFQAALYSAGATGIAEFKSYYAGLVDNVHLNSPGTKVLAVTPFRITVNANGGTAVNGITLADLRTAISDVASDASRARWLTPVDGTGAKFHAGSGTYLAPDGIHPNDLGHGVDGAEMTAQVKNVGNL